jgi:geranylgeranyl pyrophosphate synthase
LKNEKKEKNLKEKLLELGYNIGMAFQLSDDYLDIDIDTPTNNYGLETSKEELKKKYLEYINSIHMILNDINIKKESTIYEILNLMNDRFNE